MEMDVDHQLVKEFQNLNRYDVQFTKRCTEVVRDIQQGNSTFLQLIEQLQSLLVDINPENRELGMLILSEVLESLSNNFLTDTQVTFVFTFYSDRLNDHHQVVPAVLKGVIALLKCENLPKDTTKQLLGSLFQKVPCQQQQQTDRLNIYKILKISAERRFEEVKQMGFDFIYGVITAMDGERDPRNLLFLFNWLPELLRNVTLGHLTEDMFEVMACYFPVDFKAPSQDPNNISREILAKSLCIGLCAVPEFAEFCLPLALEKLTSSLPIAKLDSLHILMQGCKTFEISAYIQHSTDIWSQIQRELFNCTDKQLESVALICLEIVINKLSKGPQGIFKRTLSDITDTLKGNLLPNMKLFESSCKMLYYVAKASKLSVDHITSEIMPLLVNSYNITLTSSHQIIILNSIIEFVTIYTNVHDTDNIIEIKELSEVPNLCLKATLHQDIGVRAVGLSCLATISKSIPLDTRMCLYDNIRIWLTTTQLQIVRNSLLKCFKVMAEAFDTEIKINILDRIQITDNNALLLYLDSLIAIVDQKDFTEIVLLIFTGYIVNDISTTEIALGKLKKLLETHEKHEKIYNFLVSKEKIIQRLIDWIFQNIDNICIEDHKNLLQHISSICKLLIRSQNNEIQNYIINLKLESVVSQYRSNYNYIMIIVLDGLLTTLRSDIRGQYDIDDLIEVSLTAKSDYIQQVAVQLLTNILNKSANEYLQNDLHKIKGMCNCVLNKSDNENYLVTNAIQLMIWVTKALVMRNHSESEIWTNNLLNILKDHEEVAKGFKIIMSNDWESLSNKSNSIIRLLYRQKFFSEVSIKLANNFVQDNSNYLAAIGYLLQEAPKQVIILQFTKLLRPIVLCLDNCNNPEVLCAILEILYELIENKESLAEDHIQTFLPRLLKLTTFKCSMKVRIKALGCLQHYTSGFPIYKLWPQKQYVIHSLTQCLDDKKRLVRKEAVQARLCWFMMDAAI